MITCFLIYTTVLKIVDYFQDMKTTLAAYHLFILCIMGISAQSLTPIAYNDPDLVVDLGVGLWAWPLPMDYDQDGDLDLVVACPDVPYNGIYFFENPGGDAEMPVFKPARRIADAERYLQVSYTETGPYVSSPGFHYPDFQNKALAGKFPIPLDWDFKPAHERTRANQWKRVDYDGDGLEDFIIGIGDWTEYGWDNAFDERGTWTRGPLHGYVYFARNTGTAAKDAFAEPILLEAAGAPIDVYGMPSPNFADYDKDGDLDLICGEFLDGFTYFENIGSRTQPQYAAGKYLQSNGQEIRMDLQMITPVALDWTGDGWIDLIAGDEDGRVALINHSGKVVAGVPVFEAPRYFQQAAEEVKFGALVTPVSYDWDGDGDEDLICGNTAGYIGFIENLDGAASPKWAAPQYLKADAQVIRPMAGPNGSIQGPCEAKWGYTTLSVADWNHDNLPDLVVNSIWGKVVWYENVGTLGHPILTAARPIEVEWEHRPPKPAWNWWNPQGRELATQWRTTPYAMDLNTDGLQDLVMLDHEGYLAFFERYWEFGELRLKAPKRIFVDSAGAPLRLKERTAGGSGRRKLCFVDWDLDGRVDLLANSKNVTFYHNAGKQADGSIMLVDQGEVSDQKLAGHSTSPTAVDWDQNGIPDLLIGAEDGRLYYLQNPKVK